MKIDLAKILTGCFLLLSLLSWIIGERYLGLSWYNFLPHTLITYPFVGGSSVIDTLFSGFFLWITLSTMLMRLSEKRLLILFFSATFAIGLVMLTFLWLTKSAFLLTGPAPLMYCLLTTLLLSDRHLKIFLLGLLPIQPTTIVVILLSVNTLQNLVSGAYFQVTANLLGVLFAFAVSPLLKKRSHKMR